MDLSVSVSGFRSRHNGRAGPRSELSRMVLFLEDLSSGIAGKDGDKEEHTGLMFQFLPLLGISRSDEFGVVFPEFLQ